MIKEKRNIVSVINNILLNVEEPELINELNKFVENLVYKAPECINERENWIKLNIIVNKHVNNIKYNNYNLRKKLIDIYVNNSN
jgi:hypothetical protein